MEEDLREQLAPRPGVCLWWRFSDHRRWWGDRIVAFEFGAASAPALDDVERRTIQQLERQGLYHSAPA